jgi:hypothetical protein
MWICSDMDSLELVPQPNEHRSQARIQWLPEMWTSGVAGEFLLCTQYAVREELCLWRAASCYTTVSTEEGYLLLMQERPVPWAKCSEVH